MMKTYALLVATLLIWGMIFYQKQEQEAHYPSRIKQAVTLPKWHEIQEITIKKNGFQHAIHLLRTAQGFRLKSKNGQLKALDPFVEEQLSKALVKEIKPIQQLFVPADTLKKFALTDIALQVTLQSDQKQTYRLRIGQEVQKRDAFALFLDDQNQPILKDGQVVVFKFNERLRLLFDREDRYWQKLMPQAQPNQSDSIPQYLSYTSYDQRGDWTLEKRDDFQWGLKDQASNPLYRELSDVKLSEQKLQGLLYTISHLKLDAYIEDLQLKAFQFNPVGAFEYMDQYQQKYQIEWAYDPQPNQYQGQLKQLSQKGMFVHILQRHPQSNAVLQDYGIGYLPPSQSSFLIPQLEGLLDRSLLSKADCQQLTQLTWVTEDQAWTLKRIYSQDPILQWQWEDLKQPGQIKLVSVNAFTEYIALFQAEGIGFVFEQEEQPSSAFEHIDIQIQCPPPLFCQQNQRLSLKKRGQKILLKSDQKKKADPWLNLSLPHYEKMKAYFSEYQLK